MAEDYLPTRRQVVWLAGSVAGSIAVGVSVGVIVFGVPHLPPPAAPPPPDLIIDVTLNEFSISAQPVAVPSGTDVEFVVANDGELQHDFKIFGTTGVERVPPGGRSQFRYGRVTEDLVAWCTVTGHRDLGMEVTIELFDAAVAP